LPLIYFLVFISLIAPPGILEQGYTDRPRA
jgi:hypothetical protein